jgi:hypothetical protein
MLPKSWMTRLTAVVLAGLTAMAPVPGLALDTPSDFQLRTLLIVHPDVVGNSALTNDPCGASGTLKPWSFGALMQGMAPANQPAVGFIQDWLRQFMTQQVVNDDPVAARDINEVWSTWENAQWDLSLVPFRLMAIVNRLDLLRSPLLAGENAGEVRFVFGAVKKEKGTCTRLRFSVILEFGVRLSSCDDLKGWAQKWVDLAGLPPSDPQYRAALAHLIQPVIDPSPLRPKPNGSAIDHVRTNESVANEHDYEFREFKLDPATRYLAQDTVAMTPRIDLATSPLLADFLKSIKSNIESDDYWIPRRFPGPSNTPLLGGRARQGTPWSGPGYFALNTCSGCHVGSGVTHIDPVHGTISPFLASELGDLTRGREAFLREVASGGCAVTPKPGAPERRLVH